jgi:hypothetical protein
MSHDESYRCVRGGYRVERAMGTRREASARFACLVCARAVDGACHCLGHAVQFAGFLGEGTCVLRGGVEVHREGRAA